MFSTYIDAKEAEARILVNIALGPVNEVVHCCLCPPHLHLSSLIELSTCMNESWTVYAYCSAMLFLKLSIIMQQQMDIGLQENLSLK